MPIAYGAGRLGDCGNLCRQAGMKKPLIVTDKGSKNLPFINALQQHLTEAGLPSAIYADISPNPRDAEIAAGKTQYQQGQHDGIIALGGGNGMDAGKAICLTANNDIDIADFDYNKRARCLRIQRVSAIDLYSEHRRHWCRNRKHGDDYRHR